jgi:hypothetical protein
MTSFEVGIQVIADFLYRKSSLFKICWLNFFFEFEIKFDNSKFQQKFEQIYWLIDSSLLVPLMKREFN